MKSEIAPQARPRSRAGMLALDWQCAPTVDDMWPDKVDVHVRGHVRWADGTSFQAYARGLSKKSAFKEKPTIGRRFRSLIDYGSVKGEVKITMAHGPRADELLAGEANIDLTLYLNPTRTRAQAVRRNSEPLPELSLRRFFKPLAQVGEVFREGVGYADRDALDDNDNFFWNADEAGGTTPTSRARSRDEFLPLYEARLRQLVEWLFAPDAPGPDQGDLDRNDTQVTFSWTDLRVSYAEIYAERSTSDPVATMHLLHDRGLSLARNIRASTFSGGTARFTHETKDGFAHIVVPLTRRATFDLSVYAKTPLRIRFEVRYLRDFSRIVRRASADEHRLTSVLSLLIRDAANRLPWAALRRAARESTSTSRNDVVDRRGKRTPVAG